MNDVAVSFGYATDGLLTQAGELTLTRHPDHGSVTGTTLRATTDQYEWTGYGEPGRYQAHHPAFGSYPVFDAQYTRDDAGRITQIIETIDTIQRVWTYTYDDAGRLTTVRRNGDVAASYTYDSNGNRLTYDGDGGHEEGTYDDQDRLLTYGGATYTYAPNGELATKTVGTQVTRYTYDALGNLGRVEQPDGTLIEYVIDGRNRRVGKKVNGVLVKGWLYADQLRIVAELDGSGAVVSRFVYGSKPNVPDYMVRDGVAYRIVSDHLGSPRVVLNADTGEVVQRLDYDAFGVVRQDSNPGWQPFGFAGGLYDPDTGLVRCGARDYHPATGRWVSKDPIGFAGGDTNLYNYVVLDPINGVDPDGLQASMSRLMKFLHACDWHRYRNVLNECPKKEPKCDSKWTKDTWPLKGKYRSSTGAECDYDERGNLKRDENDNYTYNYERNKYTARHVWYDVLPHFYCGPTVGGVTRRR